MALESTRKPVTAPPCDCCGSNSWQPIFTENSIKLGRCASCGLYYIAQMPDQNQRITEMEKGHYGDDQKHSNATIHLQYETLREREFRKYVDLARGNSPAGKWLDIGCGTGSLIRLAQSVGITAEGLELTPDRREIAKNQTLTTQIYGKPLEDLNLPSESFAAVFMINVFSHLILPDGNASRGQQSVDARRNSSPCYRRNRRRSQEASHV